MTEQNTGGAAFPLHSEVRPALDHDWCGMTLRDYFAAKAMQGLLSGKLNTTNMMTIASECYMMADTMLKARQS